MSIALWFDKAMAGAPRDHNQAYQVVRERFLAAQQAFEALEAAHGEGRYQGMEHEAFVAAVEATREAVSAFRAAVDSSRRAEAGPG